VQGMCAQVFCSGVVIAFAPFTGNDKERSPL
jgi:hypothetical protein